LIPGATYKIVSQARINLALHDHGGGSAVKMA